MSGLGQPEDAGGGAHRVSAAGEQAPAYEAGRDLYLAGRDVHLHLPSGARRVEAARDGIDAVCPYPGLAAFTEDQAQWFFGRDRLTAGLLGRLNDCLAAGGPLMVVAASGAGKSSLLRAGLLHKVAQGGLARTGSRHWPRVVFTPGAHPVREAAGRLAALPGGAGSGVPADPGPDDLDGLLRGAVEAAAGQAGPGARAVIVVDQFEELFTLCDSGQERDAFISWLWRAAGHDGDGCPLALVTCGLRADFYAQCLRYPLLGRALEGQVLAGPMSEDELRQAISHPAQAAGLDIEPGLVEVLLRDLRAGHQGGSAAVAGDLAAGYDAGRLPLLAHALERTWQNRHGSTLTLEGYRAAGGIEHAIAETAERVFARLDDAGQAEARALFLRLVKIGAASGEDVRRPAPRQGLAGGGQGAGAVIEACTAARLLTQSFGTVQITHEALLRAWPRLAGWLDDDRAGQLTRQQAEDDAAEWDQAGREASRLYQGARLETTAAWAGTHGPQLTATARDFISASRRRARRTRLIKRGAIAVLAALLLIASVTSAVAGIQRSTAVRQTRLAQSEARTAQSEAKRAQSEAMAAEAVSLLSADGPLAMLLSLQAYERDPTSQASSALIEAAQQPLDELLTAGAPVFSVAFSPDGRTLAAGDYNGDITLSNVATGQKTATLADGHVVSSVAFSPDGRTLAAGDLNKEVTLWNVATGQTTATLDQGYKVWSVAFSPDGRTLAAGGDGGIILWSVATGQKTATLADRSPVQSVAFSPDGRTLAADDNDGIILWSVATGQKTATLADRNPLYSVAFSPDGRTLAAGGNDGDIILWSVATGQKTATLADRNPVQSVAFSPDGRTLAAGDSGGRITLWNVATGQKTATLADGNPLYSVAFSPDGRTLAAGGDDDNNNNHGDITLWNVAGPQQSHVTAGSPLSSVAFSRDGRTLAAGVRNGGGISLWSVATGQKTETLADRNWVSSVAFSPDGRTLAAADNDGDISLWSVATGQKTETLADRNVVSSMAFSPDGRTLAAGDFNGISLWSVATGQKTETLTDRNVVSSVAFSADGRTLAAGDDEGISLFNVATGHRTSMLPAANQVNSVAFSPDGRILAGGDDGGQISLWSVGTGRRRPSLGTGGGQVTSVAFSPGPDPVLVTGDHFGNVDFWNPDNRQLLASLPETGGGIVGLAFPASGQVLAIGAENSTITLLRQNPAEFTMQHFRNLICGKVRGNMTRAQWAEYANGQPYQKTCPQ